MTSPSETARQRDAAGRKAGFTLAEMLVVLAIVALTLAIAAPVLRDVSSKRSVVSSAREVAALLRSARAEAILSGSDARVSIDLARKEAAASWDGERVAFPPSSDIAVHTTRDELASASNASFRFFPDGSATGGSIRLTAGGQSQRIAIDWLTGRVDRAAER